MTKRMILWAAATAWIGGAAMAAGPAGRPNILFCIADDMSFPHAGAYGCTWVKTPAFDRVAREGLLFTRCYTPNAKCAPSRSCILTGRNSWQLGAAANHVPHFPKEFRTYAEALASNGWHVGCTAKGWAPGNPGGRQLTGTPFNRRTAPPPTTGIGRNDYAANFRDFLDARPAGTPFCFWYGSTEPHRAYEYGSSVAKGGKKPAEVDRVPAFWPDNATVRTDLLDYAFEIEHFDRHLGRMLDLLAERGELDNTLVVVTADNGLPFPRCKGNAYELSNHMPLAVRWAKGIRTPGRRVDDYVSFIDFAPTFLDLAGLAPAAAGMAPVAGRSLADLFRDAPAGPPRDRVLIGMERHDMGRPHDWGYPARGIFQDGWLYLRNYEPMRWPAGNPETGYLNADGGATKTLLLDARRAGGDEAWRFWEMNFGRRPAEEVYHVDADPDCITNLAGRADCAARIDAMRSRMERELAAEGDLRMAGRGREYEAFPYAEATHLDFYARWFATRDVKAGWVEPTDAETDFYRAAPSIARFEASPAAGGGTALSWSAGGAPESCATELRIDPDVGFLAADTGTVTVRPAAEARYTLTALNPRGTNTATVTVPAAR